MHVIKLLTRTTTMTDRSTQIILNKLEIKDKQRHRALMVELSTTVIAKIRSTECHHGT